MVRVKAGRGRPIRATGQSQARSWSVSLRSKTCYENPYAERLNGTLKNDYLIYYKPRTFEELVQQLDRAVVNYNQFRPHTNLKEMTPVEFENKYKYRIWGKTKKSLQQ